MWPFRPDAAKPLYCAMASEISGPTWEGAQSLPSLKRCRAQMAQNPQGVQRLQYPFIKEYSLYKPYKEPYYYDLRNIP